MTGIDLIHRGDGGRTVERMVTVHPLKAVNVLHRKMGEALQER